MTRSPWPQAAAVRPEVRVFLEDIKSHPEDDTPRLILADWLEENGTAEEAARGELIRIEVLLSQVQDRDPRRETLRRRRGELLRQYLDLWLGPLIQHFTWSFERGLVQLETRAPILITRGVAALAVPELCLWVASLKVRDVRNGNFHRLASSPFLPYLATLDLSGNLLSGGAIAALVRYPSISGLKTLLLAGNLLSAHWALALAASPHLAGLTTLDLQGNPLGNQGARYLADSPFLGNLARLRLGDNGISAEGQASLRARFGDRVSF
jgi:uncharacterized protein (TIGR02996 family)